MNLGKFMQSATSVTFFLRLYETDFNNFDFQV